MAVEKARAHLEQWNRGADVIEFEASTATVDEAAAALETEPKYIAKSLSFRDGESAMLIVTAGDAKVDNRKFKGRFGFKASMLSPDDVERFTGFSIGGVCPFGLAHPIPVYLDESLKRFEHVFPACGSAHSAIRLTLEELELYSGSQGWVDVCKGWEEN